MRPIYKALIVTAIGIAAVVFLSVVDAAIFLLLATLFFASLTAAELVRRSDDDAD